LKHHKEKIMNGEAQVLFNIVVGIAGLLGGFVLTAVWNGLKELRDADSKLADKVGQMEVLVAGSYVTNSRFEELAKALFHKLDRIEEKVDNKADRAELGVKRP
jgi:hypothetical protein